MRLDTLRVVGPVGAGKVMAAEMKRLQKRAIGGQLPEPKKAGSGALLYPFDPALARLAATYHRTASRVLWDLYGSRALRLEPLYDELRRDAAADRRGYLWDGARISVRARNLVGFPAGAMQVVGAVKNALIDGARDRGLRVSLDPDRPDVRFALRRHDDAISVSVDLGGGSQHERGWRLEAGPAPLRENLAAAMILMIRHDVRAEVLVDPLAGSGTIPIEAALLGLGAPVRASPPALHELPAFRDLAPLEGPLFADARPRVVANELDTRVVASLRGNAQAAGVADHVRVLHGDFRDLSQERIARALGGDAELSRGVIVSNPPYGGRLDSRDERALVELYDDLGAWCAERRGWRAAILCANPSFERAFAVRPRSVLDLPNANQPARLYLYDL
jgi:23S rRNA G2445 N2-methylase RlmL